MKFYKETTKWIMDYAVPNHIYLLNDSQDKMYGYLPEGESEPQIVRKPYRFDRRGRTFAVVNELGEINLDEVKSEQWKFTGSKGDTYIVKRIDGVLNCSCPGHAFRGDCKHVKEVDNV